MALPPLLSEVKVAASLLSGSQVASLTEQAVSRIRQHVLHTPLIRSNALSQEKGPTVYLKPENEQVTGSFKARGAFNKCLVLKEEAARGANIRALTSSTGNHGLACALAFSKLGIDGEIFIPENCDQEKKQNIIGTIAAEILEDLPDVDAVFASVGGGGLICGITSYIKAKRPQCKVIGCSPINSKVLHESVSSGHIVEEESFETLSEATAGSVEAGALTLDLATKLVDDWVLVDEEEIARAVFDVLKNHKKIIEGAAGVALAGARKMAQDLQGKKIAVIMCGTSISLDNLSKIMKRYV